MTGSGEVTDVGLAVALLAGGAASGLVPVVNAEALLTAATAGSPDLWLALVVSLTLGQCAAKVLIYLAAREGPRRLRPDGRAVRVWAGVRARVRRHRRGVSTLRLGGRLQPQRLVACLAKPLPGTGVTLLSAAVGMPPLAAVSVMAGAARLRLPLFVSACLAGRLVRFALIAWPVAHLVT